MRLKSQTFSTALGALAVLTTGASADGDGIKVGMITTLSGGGA